MENAPKVFNFTISTMDTNGYYEFWSKNETRIRQERETSEIGIIIRKI